MRLNNLVKVDNRFEKSVNLYLDLFSQEKIEGYIPTRSSVKILGEYCDEFLRSSGDRATILIGPYGKGKSHLLLVLLTIISQSCKGPVLVRLLERIAAVNIEVAEKLKTIISDYGTFLPVIINTNTGSLNQALMRGLTSALVRDSMNDVVPDSYFSEAIKMLDNWESNYPATFDAFVQTIGSKTISTFKKKLSNYDEEALQVFSSAYPKLTSGGVFNPIIDGDVISAYRSVNRILREKHGYSGIFIVFDEFSKYIEGHSENGFAEDMKVLQDICELCNSSKDEQMHLVCVAHKSIKSYGNSLSKNVLNAFNGVEGRLKEIYFVVSSKNNYELIADAIAKTDRFDKWADKSKKFKEIVEKSYELKSFNSLFTQEDFNFIVGRGCFPLTPVSAMLLLMLSEKIAQNERTIFTYITSKDGLSNYISNCTTADFVGVESVYDYFVPLFHDEIAQNIHHEWLKGNYAITKAETKEEAAVIKCITIIRMVNIPDEIAANDTFLSLATGLSAESIQTAVNGLLDKKLLKFRPRVNAYEFWNNVGIDIETEISDIAKKRYSKIDVAGTLTEVIKQKCILPKKHNLSCCMTRYFNLTFMNYLQFKKLKRTDYIQWNNQPDGCVILLLPSEDIDIGVVEQHVREINDPCLAVCVPSKNENCDDKVRYYLSVKALQNNMAFLDENKVMKKELDNLVEETITDLNTWYSETYLDMTNTKLFGMKGQIVLGPYGINRAISDICDEAYAHTPIINHELINRHEPTAQICRARNAILVDLLNDRDISQFEDGTSAESTIYRALFIRTKEDTGLSLAKVELDEFLRKSVDKKNCFKKIIDVLTSPPYGMRKGVLPFYLLDAMLRLKKTPVLYLNKKEIFFDVEAINNIVKHPEDYYLYVEKGSAQQSEYVHGLENEFAEFNKYCKDVDKRNELAKIACMMQSWYRSLPQTSSTFTAADYEGQNIEHIIAFRNLFAELYLNPREIICEVIPKIFDTDNFGDALDGVIGVKRDIDAHIHSEKQKAISVIRDVFGFSESADLRLSLNIWYDSLPQITKNSVFTNRTAAMLHYIEIVDTNNNEEIAGKLVYAVSGLFVEDWRSENESQFKETLVKMLEEIGNVKENASRSAQRIQIIDDSGNPMERYFEYDESKVSPSLSFFKSALDDLVEEYDGVIDNNEKLGAIMDVVKKMMK